MTVEPRLSTSDVSKLTGRAKQTLINDRHKNRGLPYVKLENSIRYLKSGIDNYIQQHRIVPMLESGKSSTSQDV
jgi:hypothetical protein